MKYLEITFIASCCFGNILRLCLILVALSHSIMTCRLCTSMLRQKAQLPNDQWVYTCMRCGCCTENTHDREELPLKSGWGLPLKESLKPNHLRGVLKSASSQVLHIQECQQRFNWFNLVVRMLLRGHCFGLEMHLYLPKRVGRRVRKPRLLSTNWTQKR